MGAQELTFYASGLYEFGFYPKQTITRDRIIEMMQEAHARNRWVSRYPLQREVAHFTEKENWDPSVSASSHGMDNLAPSSEMYINHIEINTGGITPIVTLVTTPQYCVRTNQLHAYAKYVYNLFPTEATCTAYRTYRINARAQFVVNGPYN